jgi:hypothetical protein
MCHGRVTNAMADMMMTKLRSDRSTMSLRPNRSATRPQAGDSSAVTAGVTPRLSPDHTAAVPRSVTPSWVM